MRDVLHRDFVTAYVLLCTAGSHTANNRARQDKDCTNTVQHDDSNQTVADNRYVVTVNCKLKQSYIRPCSEYARENLKTQVYFYS